MFKDLLEFQSFRGFLREFCYDFWSLGECDFQNGWCTWYNLPNSLRQDNFDWIRGKGQTQSRFTGPQADHNGDLTGMEFMK